MPEFTRPATWDDLKLLAGYLDEEGVEYALIGLIVLLRPGAARLVA